MVEKISKGWRGVSGSSQTDIATGATVNNALQFEGDPFNIIPNNMADDSDEVNGFIEPTKNEILSLIGQGSHVRRAKPNEVLHFATFVLGGNNTANEFDAVNNPGVYRHWVERVASPDELPYFTMVENLGDGGQFQYLGMIAKSLKLSSGRDDFVRLEAELMSRGSQTDNAIAKPSAVTESYLRSSDVNFLRGGTITGSVAGDDLAVGSGTSFKSKLQSWEYMIDNGANPKYEHGSEELFVSRFEFADRFLHTFNAVFEKDSTDHTAALTAETDYVIEIPITGGIIAGGDDTLNYEVSIILPKVRYIGNPIGRDGMVLVHNCEFKVLEDATYGSVIFKIINKVAG